MCLIIWSSCLCECVFKVSVSLLRYSKLRIRPQLRSQRTQQLQTSAWIPLSTTTVESYTMLQYRVSPILFINETRINLDYFYPTRLHIFFRRSQLFSINTPTLSHLADTCLRYVRCHRHRIAHLIDFRRRGCKNLAWGTCKNLAWDTSIAVSVRYNQW